MNDKLLDVLTKFPEAVYDKNSVGKLSVLWSDAFVRYYLFSFQETE